MTTAITYTELFAVLVADLEITIKRRKNDAGIRFAYGGAEYDVGNRADRMELIERITDDYVSAHADITQRTIDEWEDRGCRGERPVSLTLNTALIDRLSEAVLNEEITDPHPDKMSREEYPIMSSYQLARRQFGAHKVKTPLNRIEVPLGSLTSLGTDGRDYSYPRRRQRTIDEMIFVDEMSTNRNKEMRDTYNAFIKGKSKGMFTVNIETGVKVCHMD